MIWFALKTWIYPLRDIPREAAYWLLRRHPWRLLRDRDNRVRDLLDR